MTKPFEKTNYRVAQHWRFKTDTPEFSDTTIILAVEDHPTQGIICNVYLQYDPPFQTSPNSYTTGAECWVTSAALDRSVTELVEEKGAMPDSYGTTGEFRLDETFWQAGHHYPTGSEQSLKELAAEHLARDQKYHDEQAKQPPYERPTAELLGLWSLIAYDEGERFDELLQQHPDLVDMPLPRDETDDYCYTGEEYDECYPLMLAAELGALKIAKALLVAGADVQKANARGDTALHFAARSSSASEENVEIAELLCQRGAEPEAKNRAGQTPLTCSFCSTDIAGVLIAHGARPDVNYAIRLRMIDWVRKEIRDNPQAIAATANPEMILEDIGSLISDLAKSRHGRAIRVAKGETPTEGEDPWLDHFACNLGYGFDEAEESIVARWREHAEYERAAFLDHLDLLESAMAGGVDPNEGSALFYAVQQYDTSLAKWLLDQGADPNKDSHFLPDMAHTQEMAKLLISYGAKEDPYPRKIDAEADPWDQLSKRLKQRYV